MKKSFFAVMFVTAVLVSFAASKSQRDISFSEKIQLQSNPEFCEDGSWIISCTPVYNNLVKQSESTNDFGVISTEYSYDYEISSYVLNKQLFDTVHGFSIASKPTYTAVAVTKGVVPTIINDTITVNNKEGIVSVIADDGNRIVTKQLSFRMYNNGDTVTYYTGDTNSWVNTLYTEWYDYISHRSSDKKLITSCNNSCSAYVANNDFIYSNKDFRSNHGTSYNTELYVPASNVAFRLIDSNNAIKYSGNAIGSKVSLNTTMYGEVGDNIFVNCNHTHNWLKSDGSTGTVKVVKAYNLSKWARSKGIYTDLEIRSIADTLAYVYESAIPNECQASVAKSIILGDSEIPNYTNCISITRSPGFTISQHGTLVPQYFKGACGYNILGAIVSTMCSNGDYRKDGCGINKIEPYHSGHTCDSGRPWFWIYNKQTILLGCYQHANNSGSYIMGWRIIRDFCKENGSTFNLYDIINKKKTVVTPTI